jgi:hypothetical protein
VKSLFSKTSHERDKNIELFARVCRISKEEFEAILSTPHGLLRLMTGKYHFPAHVDVDHKRHIALELALLISDHLVDNRGNFDDINFALERYMREARDYREEEDAQIAEHNKFMEILHKVLAKDMENEKQGQIKPDEYSKEEQDVIIQCAIKSEFKKAQNAYWFRIGVLMATGLTKEEAREKIYQDLLQKGDSKKAKMLREFQDRVHPLKTDSQEPPKSPEQSAS